MANPSFKVATCFDCDAGEVTQMFHDRGQAAARGAVVGLFLLFLWLPGHTLAQQGTLNTPSGSAPGAGGQKGSADASDPITHRIEEHMSERRNSDRQKALVTDTDKLLALAQQLKLEVDKSNKEQLSIDVFKRAEQIEKLARSVKEKMRGF